MYGIHSQLPSDLNILLQNLKKFWITEWLLSEIVKLKKYQKYYRNFYLVPLFEALTVSTPQSSWAGKDYYDITFIVKLAWPKTYTAC
jgi:hypothetical protein